MLSRASTRLSQVSKQLTATQTRMASSYQGTTFKLNTGATIPAIGVGSWQDQQAQEGAILTALKAGYRHIDTARVYGTEPGVGKAIKDSGIPRSEIFLTTKLWNNSHDPNDVEPALDASLKDLGTDYVDLYLMHWPSPFKSGDNLFPKENDKIVPGKSDYVNTWKALVEVQKTGKARAVGISNFSKAELERLLKESDTAPAVHQIELHPYLQQHDFQAFHDSKGIHVTQYSPFGNANEIYDSGKHLDKLIEDPTLVEIGKKYGKTGAQTALAWGIAHGRTVIPKSKTESRLKDNFAGDFKLDADDVKKIDAIDKKARFNDPSENFGWNFYTDLDGKKQ